MSKDFCGYYSNRMSYEEVASLVERVIGAKILSDKAVKFSQNIQTHVRETLDQTNIEVKVNPEVKIYAL